MACELCGRAVPTRKTTLYSNIGMIAVHRHRTLKGEFCRACIGHYFWEYTLVTVVLGWWGLVSLFLTPMILIANAIQGLGTLRLGRSTPGTAAELPEALASALPQCPRCRAFHPTSAGLSRAVWASLIVSGVLVAWAAYLTVQELQQPPTTSNWGAIIIALSIVGLGLLSFIMLLRNPLARCAQCGYTWPARSS